MDNWKRFSTRPLANREAVVAGKNYRFTILTDGLVRYEWSADGQFEDRASTFAINRDLPVPDFKVFDSDDILEISTHRFHLSYNKKPFTPSGLVIDLKGRFGLWGSQWRYGDFGSSLGGTARTLDLVDGRTDLEPAAISRLGWAAIDDRSSMMFDGHGWVGSRMPGRDDGYVFLYGREYKAAMQTFYKLSGNQPALPRWAFGNWWSRYYAYRADEYIDLMDKFRSENIPLSVAVIDMDWHLVQDERVTTAGWTGYSWDKKLIPDPGAFGKDLHARNLKITLNDHPADGVHAFEDDYEEMAKALNHDTSHKNPILFDPTNPKFMKAYLEILHRNVEKKACDFWWIDWQQGQHSRIPGIDPLWMLNHFHFIDNEKDGQRPLIFSRYAGPGSHRYPVGFSGDTIVTWDSLNFQPEFTARASNIGYGYWSHDIGGHMNGSRSDELVCRWVQFGVFSPIMRLHSSSSQWQSKEPWLFREESQIIMTEVLQYRHRMMPYLYTMNTARGDQPLIQPMYWDFPWHDDAYSVPNQYMFGSELTVAPVTSPRDPTTNLGMVKAWLPPGSRHIDIFTGIVYDGDREINVYRPLQEIPVFAHEGSILPLDASLAPKNGGYNPDAFELLVVVGKDGHFAILEDVDDDDNSSKTQAKLASKRSMRSFNIEYTQKDGKLSITTPEGTAPRDWTVRFLGLSSIDPSDVKVSNNKKAISSSSSSSSGVKITIETFPKVPSLVVHIPASSLSSPSFSSKIITINLGTLEPPQLDIFDIKPRVRKLLLDYQCVWAHKDHIWDAAVKAHVPLSSRVARLMSLGIPVETLLGPALELLLADSRCAF